MKYSELHRMIRSYGWKYVRSTGSHYFYERNGVISEPVPFHGSKEIPEGLKNKILKNMR